MNDAPSQSQDKYIVRLPSGMRDRIKAYADRHGRSMNAEIVVRLKEAYEAELGLAVLRIDFLAPPEELNRMALRLERTSAMLRAKADSMLTDKKSE